MRTNLLVHIPGSPYRKHQPLQFFEYTFMFVLGIHLTASGLRFQTACDDGIKLVQLNII